MRVSFESVASSSTAHATEPNANRAPVIDGGERQPSKPEQAPTRKRKRGVGASKKNSVLEDRCHRHHSASPPSQQIETREHIGLGMNSNHDSRPHKPAARLEILLPIKRKRGRPKKVGTEAKIDQLVETVHLNGAGGDSSLPNVASAARLGLPPLTQSGSGAISKDSSFVANLEDGVEDEFETQRKSPSPMHLTAANRSEQHSRHSRDEPCEEEEEEEEATVQDQTSNRGSSMSVAGDMVEAADVDDIEPVLPTQRSPSAVDADDEEEEKEEEEEEEEETNSTLNTYNKTAPSPPTPVPTSDARMTTRSRSITSKPIPELTSASHDASLIANVQESVAGLSRAGRRLSVPIDDEEEEEEEEEPDPRQSERPEPPRVLTFDDFEDDVPLAPERKVSTLKQSQKHKAKGKRKKSKARSDELDSYASASGNPQAATTFAAPVQGSRRSSRARLSRNSSRAHSTSQSESHSHSPSPARLVPQIKEQQRAKGRSSFFVDPTLPQVPSYSDNEQIYTDDDEEEEALPGEEEEEEGEEEDGIPKNSNPENDSWMEDDTVLDFIGV